MQIRATTACSVAISLLLAMAAGAAAAETATESGQEASGPAAASEFLIGNTVFVLAHEFGHAIIRDFNVLILAERATAATSPDPGTFSRRLGMAAVGNVLTWRSGLEVGNPELVYWAQHDLSARRAARILCLLVGSDEAKFGWLVEAGLVPEVRAERCPDEYALAAHAVAWVGRSYGRLRDGKPADEGREITIRYFDPATPAQAALLRRLRDRQTVEKVADFYDRAFRFPEPLSVAG
jgi:hypothetical protein